MNHLPRLITDLALILGAAGVTTIIFRWLKQPVVLGYILAGLLVGPNFKLFPSVTDIEDIRIWADIGVIFLLFALGLEFSFKKLAKLGPSAGITGVVEISAMMIIGFGTGKAMGWPLMDCLFLGGIIAISSTTIIFRAFEELGIKTKQFTSLVIGVLVVEDLVAVLLMVLLSTMAVSNEFEGSDMLLAIGRLLFFLSLWFLLGIFLLPTLLNKASKWLNNETLMVGAIGLCLGMVVFADKVGFSAALGAFVMGSILSETAYGEKIEQVMLSVKNLFGAVFFVSVGMLINPAILWEYIVPVLLLTVVVIVGKLLFVTTGALLAGRPLKQAVQAGSSMTQIGEFSFIIAKLGLSLKVTGEFLYPIAVGVSVITTFFTPYMVRFSEPLYSWIYKVMPAKWTVAIDNYSAGTQVLKGESDWKIVVRAFVQLVVVNAVLLVACIVASRYYLKPWMLQLIDNRLLANIVALVISLSVMSPFVWALTAKKIQRNAYRALWLDSKYNHGPLVTMEIVRNVLAIIFVGFLLRLYLNFIPTIIGTVVVMVVVLLVFRNRLQHFYHRIEQRFMNNLKDKEKIQKTNRLLAPWDAHLSRVRISPSSQLIGNTLEDLAIREKYGINIAFIERGNKLIYAPARQEKLFPYDEIGVIGTDMQLQKFIVLVESAHEEDAVPVDVLADQIILEKVVVDERNGLRGKTIRESGIRENTNGLVVGIERRGERLLNPESNTIFEWEDIIWLVGDRRKIAKTYFNIHPGGNRS